MATVIESKILNKGSTADGETLVKMLLAEEMLAERPGRGLESSVKIK